MTTIKGSTVGVKGTSTTTVGQDGSGEVYVKGNNVFVQAKGDAKVVGNYAILQSTNNYARVWSQNSCVYLDPSTSSCVAGQGKMRWALGTGTSGTSSPAPFKMTSASVSLSKKGGTTSFGSNVKPYSGSVTLSDTTSWSYVVTGVYLPSNAMVNEVRVNGDQVSVYVYAGDGDATIDATVYLMGINKNWVQ